MERKYFHSTNGQELEQSDLNLIAEDAALADDRVLAELFRLKPFDSTSMSTPTKGLLPFTQETLGGGFGIIAGNGATGSVIVLPFRAFVGANVTASSDPKANWRDIRTVVFVGTNTSPATTPQSQTVTLSSNSSGFARWDLIYVRVDVDADETGVTRYIKSAGPPVTETPTTVAVVKATTALVSKVTGTPSATPDVPTIPSDSGSTYYIPIAYVRVPDGFNSTSVVIGETDIAECGPIIKLNRAVGVVTAKPATSQYRFGGAAIPVGVYRNWGATGSRPAVFMPPSMTGEEVLYIALDLSDASSVNWSHQDGSTVDDGNWLNRVFTWTATVSGVGGTNDKIPWDLTAGAISPGDWWDGRGYPSGAQDITDIQGYTFGFGQSFLDSSGGSNLAYVCKLDRFSTDNQIANPGNVQIYVDLNDNKLKFTSAGSTPLCRVFIRLCASAPYNNR